jgi:hypothetical protein
MDSMLRKVGGRKLILAFFLTITGVLVELFSAKGLTQNLLVMFGTIYTGFAVGNVAETMSGHKTEVSLATIAAPVSEAPQAPSEDNTVDLGLQIIDKLNTLETKIDAITKSCDLNNQGLTQLIGFIRSIQR